MSWWQIPSSVRAITLAFLIGAFLASQGHPGVGAAFFVGLSLVGILVDGARYGWKLYWTWTRECAWCSKRISPLTRNKIGTRELRGTENWYCSPRCYTEWHRRHYTERKQFNLLNEGGPIVSIGKGIGG